MTKLALVLSSAACFAALVLGDEARAEDTCSIGELSLEDFSEEYFLYSQARTFTPLQLAEVMLEDGCADEAKFEQLIGIFLDERTPPLHLRDDGDKWRISDIWVRVTTELLMLGYDEPLRELVADLRAGAESGDPSAMTAFAYLANYQTTSLLWRIQKARYEWQAEEAVQHFSLTDWMEDDDHPILTIAPGLHEEAPPFLEHASQAGFAPAHILRLSEQRPDDFTPCSASVRSSGTFFGLSVESDAEEGVPTNRFLENFSPLPDRERIARDLMEWSRDIIEQSLAPDPDEHWWADRYRWHPNVWTAARIAYAYAGIRSNCAFSTGEHALDFGVKDLEEAGIGLHHAVISPGQFLRFDTPLVFAWYLDAFHDTPERHYAAARILPQGAYNEGDEHRDENIDRFIDRLSRETIREAQKIMAEHGYYTAGIDGIPGPNFRAGLRQWSYFCHKDRDGSYPDKCVWAGSALLEADWARPFLRDVMARR
jgi:hypothetical protein